MKAAPVLRGFRAVEPGVETLLIHTGQHYDSELSGVFIRELDLPEPDVFLGVGSGSHADQTARALVRIAGVLEERPQDLVVVFGDVNSTLAAALAAAKVGVPVAHVEAGLRSFDPTMPEELNRKLTDHVSALLLVHSRSALDNLAAEGIDPASVKFVGNTMIDSLFAIAPSAREARPWDKLGLLPKRYGVVTLHRPALVDDPELLVRAMGSLLQLAEEECPLVFPVHPRTANRISAQGLDPVIAGSRLILTPPLGYAEFVGLESEARFVVTDSGGVQEETSALGVPCFTLRDSTERPVTVELGTNTLLGLQPASILEIPGLLGDARPAGEIPLWDGRAGDRAAAALASFVRGTVAAVGAAG